MRQECRPSAWIRTDTGDSGNAVDFFVKIRGMSFIETMRLLLA
ncbi:MAG: hypothetical protein P5686_23495 [Limnospira sp. PMC 1254.20]|nr:hypothetical protein [Limnospira sp. PMC 1254.20]MDT9257191.1 hypothetical protein [Limnospira sp. PMC 1254.20]